MNDQQRYDPEVYRIADEIWAELHQDAIDATSDPDELYRLAERPPAPLAPQPRPTSNQERLAVALIDDPDELYKRAEYGEPRHTADAPTRDQLERMLESARAAGNTDVAIDLSYQLAEIGG